MNTTTKLDPPALKVDAELTRITGQPYPHAERRAEQRVIWNLLHVLAAAGWTPDHVWDGEGATDTKTALEVMEEVFNRDVSTVYFTGQGAKRWVYFVLGNSPDEVISDYTVHNDNFAAIVNDFKPEYYT